ncbi:hypothetical protein CHR29_28260 (plasmid) [Pseudomonas monteilii]|nr:hypothetical protein CHR29_28260 [Pseudomonas monteilii]PUA08607.1 hypothetical protein DB390_29720 [Pseudomonas aeruginosa]
MNWNDRNVVLVMQQFESGHAMTVRTVLIVNIDLVNVHAIEYRVQTVLDAAHASSAGINASVKGR